MGTYVHAAAWGTTKAAVMEWGLVEAGIPPSSRRERQIEAGSVVRVASAAYTNISPVVSTPAA
jgi:hypothetical protein